MADIGSLVETLIEAGTPPSVAAQVVAMAFAAGIASADVRGQSADISAEKRREKDRIRKQIVRDNLRISADVRGNPQSENASLSKEDKKEEIKEEREERKRTVRGHRLPDDWRPTADDRPEALAKLGSSQAVEHEVLKFHDYWKAQPGQRGVKLDWDATWRNWIRNAKVQQQNGRRTVHDAARDLHENLLDRIAEFDKPAPRSLCGPEGSDVVRLLPAGRRE